MGNREEDGKDAVRAVLVTTLVSPGLALRRRELIALHERARKLAEFAHTAEYSQGAVDDYDEALHTMRACYSLLCLAGFRDEITALRLAVAKESVKQERAVNELEDKAAVTRGSNDALWDRLYQEERRLLRLLDQRDALGEALRGAVR